jgi:hypothetical protein
MVYTYDRALGPNQLNYCVKYETNISIFLTGFFAIIGVKFGKTFMCDLALDPMVFLAMFMPVLAYWYIMVFIEVMVILASTLLVLTANIGVKRVIKAYTAESWSQNNRTILLNV